MITPEMLAEHVLWVDTRYNDVPEGKQLVIIGADLSGAKLSGANLSYANLSNADLSAANLRYANLSEANLSEANLRYANLSNANLSEANLSEANLRYANLSNANLSEANLRYANLSEANLSSAYLSYADLNNANLSGSIGLLSASVYIAENFETTSDGVIGYKTFGYQYAPNVEWDLSVGSTIQEVVNFSRQSDCGCGVNVGTKAYIKRIHNNSVVWKVLIRWAWLPGVCVPYATDGKIRCEQVELIEEMSREEFLAICNQP